MTTAQEHDNFKTTEKSYLLEIYFRKFCRQPNTSPPGVRVNRFTAVLPTNVCQASVVLFWIQFIFGVML